VRAVQLSGRDGVSTANDIASGDITADDVLALLHVVLEVHSTESGGASEQVAEHRVRPIANGRSQHRAEDSTAAAEIMFHSARQIIRERLDRSSRANVR